MTTSEFIKGVEGFRSTPYRDTAGNWTVGWGHKFTHLTVSQCEVLLADDITIAESAIETHVLVPLTANQRTVLTSFIFNVGVQAFVESTLLKVLNAKNYAGVPGQLRLWIHDGGHIDHGLVNRRADEVKLWNSVDTVGSST